MATKKKAVTLEEAPSIGAMIKEGEQKRYAGVEPGVIPESRVFGGGGDRIAALAGLNVGGVPIEKWCEGKSDFEISLMSFAFTDEGLEQQRRAAAARALRTRGTGADVTDETEKWLIERGDQRLDPTFNPAAAVDRRLQLAEEHVPVGFSPRFLSKKSLRGGDTDVRGYEVVKVNGVPVTDGESVLGKIPESKAGVRRRLYQREQNLLLKQTTLKTGEGRRGRTNRTGAAIMERGESLIPDLPVERIGDKI